MKIVKAEWERRNLGCDAYEITLDRKDLRDTRGVMDTLRAQNFGQAYVVVKMPVGNLEMLHALEDDGFRFMETQFHVIDHFTPRETPEQIRAWQQNAHREIVPKKKECWEQVISRITPGMFDTDRVSLDPVLGKEVACLRYQNWCRDLFDNPHAWMWVLKVDGEEVSFGVNVRDEERQVDDGILGGVFERFKGMGYGMFQAFDVDASSTKTKTTISSNNLAMLRIFQDYGRIIYKEMYVLRKIFTARKK